MGELPVVQGERSLVGGDRIHPGSEGREEMARARFAVLEARDGHLDDHIARDLPQRLREIPGVHRGAPESPARLLGPQDAAEVEPVRIRDAGMRV
jgi:hypothetical protein